MTAIVFDCDTGVDDAMAIMYGAGNGADFVACTVTHGNVPVEIGARNTLTVLDAVGLDHVPVHQGAARPMAQPLHTSEWVHGDDGLGNSNPTPSARPLAGNLAAVEIVRLARERPGELTLVAVGPMTNIGLALLLEPELPRLVRRIVVMGGAAGVPGNASPVAEANFWHDPEAAALVLDAPWEVVHVGLEATMRAMLPPAAIERLARVETPHGRLLWAAMQHYLDIYSQIEGTRTCALHDPLAVALALDPDLASYRLVRMRMELRGEHTRGQGVADLRGYEPDPVDPLEPGVVRLVTDFDLDTFVERFLTALGA